MVRSSLVGSSTLYSGPEANLLMILLPEYNTVQRRILYYITLHTVMSEHAGPVSHTACIMTCTQDCVDVSFPPHAFCTSVQSVSRARKLCLKRGTQIRHYKKLQR